MGETPSKCCRSDLEKRKDVEEASGEEETLPDLAEAVVQPRAIECLSSSSKSSVPLDDAPDHHYHSVSNINSSRQNPDDQEQPERPISPALTTPKSDMARSESTKKVQWSMGNDSQIFVEASNVTHNNSNVVETLSIPSSPATSSRHTGKMLTTVSTSKFASKVLQRSDSGDTGSQGSGEQPEVIEEDQNPDTLIDNLVSSALGGPDGRVSVGLAGGLGSNELGVGSTTANQGAEDGQKVLIKRLFRNEAGEISKLSPHHVALNRIVGQLFHHEDEEFAPKTTTPGSDYKCFTHTRKFCSKIIKNNVFTVFFMALTLYAIFGFDVVLLYASKDLDDGFMIANTVVFFLFCIELVLTMIGKKKYICSISFILDFVSVISILSDTWFFKNMNIFSGGGAEVSRMARSSRLTRLARIVRVARVTRLIPRLMAMCGRQREDLGKRLLERRLWRSFLFLDQDFDSRIDYFDVKCLYVAILAEGRHMLRDTNPELLQHDLSKLCAADGQPDSYLGFQEFKHVILSTMLGKQISAFHIASVDRNEGVWNLTQKLSDNVSLKVCVGLLTLIGVMSLLEDDALDRGPEQGLLQLHEIAASSISPKYMCDQIGVYKSKFKLMYVYLDGKKYFENSAFVSDQCFPQGIAASIDAAKDHLKDIISKSPFRDTEIMQACWPDTVKCKTDVTSMSLVDNHDNTDMTTRASLVTTAIVIFCLLIFVYVLNMGITNFSKTLLQPLRALVDDMAAMSALELVHIDREMPQQESNKSHKVAEELQHLQGACKSMRGAIKSWSKYVPPAVVQRLFSQGVEAKIGVAKVTVTILFCDILDFEAGCRGLTPEEVLQLLEEVLGRIADVIARHRGTLLEFIGDEVLAVFNAPNALKNHVHAGVTSALEIHRILASMPPLKSDDGRDNPIRCRCGVNTCVILAGNIGSSQRMKYGLLGDGINLTARLKGINTRYQTRTLVSDKVYADEKCKRSVVFRPVDLVTVKGKTQPTTVYEALADKTDSSPLERAAEKHRQAFSLYKEREFVQAKALFEEVRLTFENEGTADEPSRMLRSRCQHYIDNPPPDDWDGVERLAKK